MQQINHNKNTNNMAHDKNNFVTHLFANLVCTILLCTSQTAHADFRKALTAYQNRDGKTMLAEVQDAVDKKNDDGLVLLLSVLEADTWIAKDRQFLSAGKPISKLSPVEKLFKKEELNSLVGLLKAAAIQSNSVSQLRFYWFMSALNLVHLSKFSEVYQKGLTGGVSTHDKLSEAMNTLYSLGSPEKKWQDSAIKDEAKGLKLLKNALARPDAHLHWGRHGNTISQYYYDKFLQKKNTVFLRQAYAWDVLNYTSEIYFSGYFGGDIPIVITKMQKKGLLVKVAPELSAILSAPLNENDIEQKKHRFKAILKSIEQVELPELIRKNHKIDLKKQPVLSLRRINYDGWRAFVDSNFMVDAGTSVLNFSLEIYEDGRVIFTQGHRGLPQFNRVKNSEVLLKITPNQVATLLTEVKQSGIKTAPLVTIGTEDYGYCKYCLSLESNVSFASNYTIGIRDRKNYKEVKFIGSNLAPSFAKVYQLLEEHIPTQKYRCGIDKETDFYQFCINRDKQLFEIANQGDNK